MKVLAQVTKDGIERIYYTLEDRALKGYVYQMSRSITVQNAGYDFEGWLCSIPAWERTFKQNILKQA